VDAQGTHDDEYERYVYDGQSLDVLIQPAGDSWPGEGRGRGGFGNAPGTFDRRSEYIRANGALLSRIDTGLPFRARGTWGADDSTSYYHQDILASTMMITDERGRARETYTWDAFGGLLDGNLAAASAVGYNGKLRDPSTGWYNYGYRDYMPQLGRWTTVDPIKSGSNWYAYVNGDPVNYVDLWGLSASDAAFSAPPYAAELGIDYPQPPGPGPTYEEMAAWNASHPYTSGSWLPGSYETAGFVQAAERLLLLSGDYLTYLHTGIDRAGTSDVVSPGYYVVVSVEDANRVILERIGSDTQNRLVHLADTSNLVAGQILSPGDAVGQTSAAGPSTGQHLHNEESTMVNGTRVFVDPDTHVPAPADVEFYWQVERESGLPEPERRQEGPVYVTTSFSPNVKPKRGR
jgi:RHS repeat-associated protein